MSDFDELGLAGWRDSDSGLVHIHHEDHSLLPTVVFFVATPTFGDSGIGHVCEHLVFRRSRAYDNPATLFQLQSLLPGVTINGSTFDGVSCFHASAKDSEILLLLLDYLACGLWLTCFDREDLAAEVHGPDNKGVVFREMSAWLQDDRHSDAQFDIGGRPQSIKRLNISHIDCYLRRYYRPSATCVMTTGLVDTAAVQQILRGRARQCDRPLGRLARGFGKVDLSQLDKYPAAVRELLTRFARLSLSDVQRMTLANFGRDGRTLQSYCSGGWPNEVPQAALTGEASQDEDRIHPLLQPMFDAVAPQLHGGGRCVCAVSERNWLGALAVASEHMLTARVLAIMLRTWSGFLKPRIDGECYLVECRFIESLGVLLFYTLFDINTKYRAKWLEGRLDEFVDKCTKMGILTSLCFSRSGVGENCLSFDELRRMSLDLRDRSQVSRCEIVTID